MSSVPNRDTGSNLHPQYVEKRGELQPQESGDGTYVLTRERKIRSKPDKPVQRQLEPIRPIFNAGQAQMDYLTLVDRVLKEKSDSWEYLSGSMPRVTYRRNESGVARQLDLGDRLSVELNPVDEHHYAGKVKFWATGEFDELYMSKAIKVMTSVAGLAGFPINESGFSRLIKDFKEHAQPRIGQRTDEPSLSVQYIFSSEGKPTLSLLITADRDLTPMIQNYSRSGLNIRSYGKDGKSIAMDIGLDSPLAIRPAADYQK